MVLETSINILIKDMFSFAKTKKLAQSIARQESEGTFGRNKLLDFCSDSSTRINKRESFAVEVDVGEEISVLSIRPRAQNASIPNHKSIRVQVACLSFDAECVMVNHDANFGRQAEKQTLELRMAELAPSCERSCQCCQSSPYANFKRAAE